MKNLKLYNFMMLTLAGIINAVGVTILLAPVNLFDSGISGTAFLLDRITPPYLIMSMFLIVLNFPFYIMGCRKIGLEFVIYSLYAISIYALSTFLIRNVLPIDLTSGSPITGTDILLSALFGGLVSGIGSGLVIRFGGAIDGVEVMAVLFAKKIGMTVGTFVMIYNVLLYMISGVIYADWQIPLYSIVAYVVGVHTIDFIVEGLDKAKAVFIIANKNSDIPRLLSESLGRGVTILGAKGYYSDSDKNIIYCVVNRFEIARVKRIVESVDENAFVTINEISETIGGETFKFNLKKTAKRG